MKNENKKYLIFIFGILIIANFAALCEIIRINTKTPLLVDFFDVGQGDSAYIETSFGHQILIDGGPSVKVLDKLSGVIPFFDRTLDLVILTHPEKDHLFGLIEVLKRYKVENILWTGVEKDSPEYSEWLNLLKQSGAKVEIAQAGERVIVSDNPQIFIDILNPTSDISGEKYSEVNDTSIVSLLSFSNNKFLFTGDINEKQEKKMLADNLITQSDVLKIAHHGSKTSTSEDFLNMVKPRFAIISVGKDNSYGHPNSEVLEKLNKFGIQVLRTDNLGDIKIIFDGQNLKIK
jgi:competence protein ComEC